MDHRSTCLIRVFSSGNRPINRQGATISARRNRKVATLAIQAAELAAAAPLVVAHRLSRLVLAGHIPTSRDQREFTLMGAEKVAAFHESWNAMFIQSMRIQQGIAASMWRSFRFPWLDGRSCVTLPKIDLPHAALSMMSKGMAPVHRRVVANARRLGRTGKR